MIIIDGSEKISPYVAEFIMRQQSTFSVCSNSYLVLLGSKTCWVSSMPRHLFHNEKMVQEWQC